MSSPNDLVGEIRRLIDLIDREINVIRDGDLSSLPEILPEKVELVRSLEGKSEQLNALIALENEEAEELRNLLTKLRSLTQQDSRLVARMANSVKEVLRDAFGRGELERLNGIYDSQGRIKTPSRTSAERFDRSL